MGKTWGRWRSVRKLGQGGQGYTFLVVDQEGPETLRVLKRLRNTTSPERRARFEQEINAIKKLRHPNVVELIDYDLEAAEPFLVMDYCHGGSVGDLGISTVPDGVLREWTDHVCEALRAAHSIGLVHRDVKPDNIFLRSREGPAVLGDFGLVFIDGGERVTLTQEQVGSRFFMPPELRDGRVPRVTPAADVYSLGKTIYWMFSHGNIFDRENFRDAPNNVVTIRRNYALEHLNIVLDRMISFDPERRFEHAGPAAGALREAWRLMDGSYNPLTRADQPCRYCGRGFYQLLPNDAYFSLGLNSGAINVHNYRILKCSVCGNMQSFWVSGSEDGDWIDRVNVPRRQ